MVHIIIPSKRPAFPPSAMYAAAVFPHEFLPLHGCNDMSAGQDGWLAPAAQGEEDLWASSSASFDLLNPADYYCPASSPFFEEEEEDGYSASMLLLSEDVASSNGSALACSPLASPPPAFGDGLYDSFSSPSLTPPESPLDQLEAFLLDSTTADNDDEDTCSCCCCSGLGEESDCQRQRLEWLFGSSSMDEELLRNNHNNNFSFLPTTEPTMPVTTTTPAPASLLMGGSLSHLPQELGAGLKYIKPLHRKRARRAAGKKSKRTEATTARKASRGNADGSHNNKTKKKRTTVCRKRQRRAL
ncbi:hypothetical protein QOT17_002927 [Balamuthia mandrillaris]